jgi:monothiol glutaredoxin
MAANPELREQLQQAINGNRVLLLMKGTPEAPRCGFSMRTVGVLEQIGVEYGAIDVLPVLAPLREVTAELSEWETFPQLYVNGELIGGCELAEEMLESGELAEMIGVSQPEDVVTGGPQPADEGPHQSPPMQIET